MNTTEILTFEDQVINYILRNGSCTRVQIEEHFPSKPACSIQKAITYGLFSLKIVRGENGTFDKLADSNKNLNIFEEIKEIKNSAMNSRSTLENVWTSVCECNYEYA